ncbi:hypothetical protein [Peribacillus sp. NPDC058002]|uniref:hypothetical protein n=1 Tax=Peribacillus sp. NPDC058002 TaxID=3346301 RepID=UPI0036DE3E44
MLLPYFPGGEVEGQITMLLEFLNSSRKKRVILLMLSYSKHEVAIALTGRNKYQERKK